MFDCLGVREVTDEENIIKTAQLLFRPDSKAVDPVFEEPSNYTHTCGHKALWLHN